MFNGKQMALRFYGLLFLVICLSGNALASDQYKTVPKPVLNKSYGQLLGSSRGKKLSLRTSAHIRKLAARLKKERHGACVLFTGRNGTAKTLGAGVLGSTLVQGVYRVDLAGVISKYIGETEKNLAQVFEQAEARHWVLFFDEADTLFGKRTDIKDAHDRYAHQLKGYLLRLLQHHHGIVVLATNHRSNVDPAFRRRCRYEIKFQ